MRRPTQTRFGCLFALFVAVTLNAVSIQALAAPPGKSIAFFYAASPPVGLLSQFDRLVLEPDNISAGELTGLTAAGAEPYAYLSIGEVGPHRRYGDRVKAMAALGTNPAWGSRVMDLSKPAWTNFLLEQTGRLQRAGYSGLFLDTLDSFTLYAQTPEMRAVQERALTTLIAQLRQQYPSMKLIANRGFEVMDAIAPYLEAVAAESLFAGWDNSLQTYQPVPAASREWLLAKLYEVREDHGLELIAIDYLPATRREEARAVAADIAALGIVPWVTTPALDQVGLSTLEVFPRKVLMLYDSRHDGLQEDANIHRFAALPLEYAGFVPVYVDLATDELPGGVLKGRYAGVVTWTDSPYEDHAGLPGWFEYQLASGIPLAMFGGLPVTPTPTIIEHLGIELVEPIDTASLRIVQRDAMISGERELPPRIDGLDLDARSIAPANTTHLRIGDVHGNVSDAVVTGHWGGYAINPFVITTDIDETVYWLIDPFVFMEQALRLPRLPMPDVTTRAGNRLWFAHIDGDALPSWAEMPGKRLGAEVVESEILDRYRLPHTVSIVEAEMTSVRAYADRRSRMFDTARRLFARADVELASHTFSHPFHWRKVLNQDETGSNNLPVPGYEYDVEREVSGSIGFIDRLLAPPGKHTKMLLWSGNALPGKAAMQAVDRLGLVAMNGGNTVINRELPALGLVSPMVRSIGSNLQIYAPIMNENVYTNDWLGPFDGFRRVIETLEMTDRPRRLKPLNIYYHFYIGTKTASLRSLREVYDWSLTQDISPIHTSEYASMVPDFRRAGVARYLDGTWKLSSLGSIRSLRFVGQTLWPELSHERSSDAASAASLIGVRHLHDGTYLHTDGSDTVLFNTTSREPKSPYVVASNGRVDHWQRQDGVLHFRVRGYVPVFVEFGAVEADHCQVRSGDQVLAGKRTEKDTLRFDFSDTDTGDATLHCDA